MRSVAALRDLYKDRPAVILGGGPSLPKQFEKVPTHYLRISVNQHGNLLTRCDYTVFKDHTMAAVCKRFDVLTVSVQESDPDYFWTHKDGVRDMGFSSSVAVWLALHMGCSEVVLCGMDCYQGDATYWHTPKAASTGHFWDTKKHVDRWRECFPFEPRIRAMGGLLTEVFPTWQSPTT